MSMSDRVSRFREQVAECQAKAAAAKTDETRRAWLICARDWQRMHDKEELRYVRARHHPHSQRRQHRNGIRPQDARGADALIATGKSQCRGWNLKAISAFSPSITDELMRSARALSLVPTIGGAGATILECPMGQSERGEREIRTAGD